MQSEGSGWSPEKAAPYEVPASEITVGSSKRSSGTKIELVWDTKRNQNQKLQLILDRGKSSLSNYFSDGGRRVGHIILRAEVEGGMTEAEVEQKLRDKLNSLVAAALSGVEVVTENFSLASRYKPIRKDRSKMVRHKRMNESGSARQATYNALYGDE